MTKLALPVRVPKIFIVIFLYLFAAAFTAFGQEPRCQKCGKVVYPTEKIQLSGESIWHGGCFKCVKCGRQLNLLTFALVGRAVYCKNHVPRPQEALKVKKKEKIDIKKKTAPTKSPDYEYPVEEE